MPARAGQQRHRPVALRGQQFLRLRLDGRFDGPAFLVQQVEFLRDLRGLRRVVGGEQPHAQVRLPHAPARIDARAQREAQVVAERSEEHTSELQSLMRISYAVFCLKNKTKISIKDRPSASYEYL